MSFVDMVDVIEVTDLYNAVYLNPVNKYQLQVTNY